MKKILALLLILAIGKVSMAQDTSMMKHPMKRQDKMMYQQPAGVNDHVMMKSGKMMFVKNSKSTPMQMSMTMKNGTVVMPDGTVKLKDGTTKMLMNGDCVYMNGTITKMKMKDK